jgi:hypothetical protein
MAVDSPGDRVSIGSGRRADATMAQNQTEIRSLARGQSARRCPRDARKIMSLSEAKADINGRVGPAGRVAIDPFSAEGWEEEKLQIQACYLRKAPAGRP